MTHSPEEIAAWKAMREYWEMAQQRHNEVHAAQIADLTASAEHGRQRITTWREGDQWARLKDMAVCTPSHPSGAGLSERIGVLNEAYRLALTEGPGAGCAHLKAYAETLEGESA